MLVRTRVLVGAGAVIAVAGAGIAYAAWSSTGDGSGQVGSTTSVNSVITAGNAGEALYPGSTSTFTVMISNPNSYPVKVNTISAGSSAAVGGCAAGTVTSDAVGATSGTIAAGASGTYGLTAHMSSDASDACKNAVFTLSLTSTLQSAG